MKRSVEQTGPGVLLEAKPAVSLRQHYAGLAMQGMLTTDAFDRSAENIAALAFMYADALIRAEQEES